MSNSPRHAFFALVCLAAGAASAFAQALPTSQPKILQIYREQVKTGHAAAHVKTEAGLARRLREGEVAGLLPRLVLRHGTAGRVVPQPVGVLHRVGQVDVARRIERGTRGGAGETVGGGRRARRVPALDRGDGEARSEPRGLPGPQQAALLGDHHHARAPRARRPVRRRGEGVQGPRRQGHAQRALEGVPDHRGHARADLPHLLVGGVVRPVRCHDGRRHGRRKRR